MNFHWPFFHKPAPVRYVVATREESRKAAIERASTKGLHHA